MAMPKRRKSKDNPYKLNFKDGDNVYTISFKDVKNEYHEVIISEDLFKEFNNFELEDISQLHKVDKYIDLRLLDNTENTDIYLYYNTKLSVKESVLEKVENNILQENLKKAINELPEIQKRRLRKYYFENMTFEEIAREENCSKRAIKFSVDIAIEKISQKLKK